MDDFLGCKHHLRNTPCQQAENDDFGRVVKNLTKKNLVVVEATPLNKNVNMGSSSPNKGLKK